MCNPVVHLGSRFCLERAVEKNESCQGVRTTDINATNNQTNYLTNCMEQSPSWEANKFSASQEIPRI